MKPYINNNKGHKWVKRYGEVDIFAYEEGNHNGPRCSVCGYGFCHHCRSVPEIKCLGKPKVEREAMSKRKYAKDVTPRLHTWALEDGELCFYTDENADEKPSSGTEHVPVRIIRESFYRKLIKAYEKRKP